MISASSRVSVSASRDLPQQRQEIPSVLTHSRPAGSTSASAMPTLSMTHGGCFSHLPPLKLFRIHAKNMGTRIDVYWCVGSIVCDNRYSRGLLPPHPANPQKCKHFRGTPARSPSLPEGGYAKKRVTHPIFKVVFHKNKPVFKCTKTVNLFLL